MDPLWSDPQHRLRRHRQLPADGRLARRRAQHRLRPRRRPVHDLRQGLSRRPTSRAARITTGITPSAADRVAQTRTPIADTAHGQALGVPPEGHPQLVGERRISRRPGGVRRRPPRRPTCRRASRSGSPSSAARPSTRGRTSRTSSTIRSRSEASLPYFSLGLEGRPDPARLSRGDARLLARPCAGLDGLRRPDAARPADMFAWAWDARPYPGLSRAAPPSGTTRRITSSATG